MRERGDGHRQTQADITSKSRYGKRGYPGGGGNGLKKKKQRQET